MTDPYLNSLLGEREQIVLVTRQHWFVLVQKTLAKAVLAILLIVLVTLVWTILLPLVPLVAVGYLLVILPIAALAADFAVWWNRKFIVTTRRVIHLSGVLSKDVTDSSLDKVNDVKMEQTFLGRMFGYGDIEILTASELGVNLFKQIGDPIRFKTAMLNAKERMDHGEPAAAGPRDTSVPALLAQLDNLRKQGVLTEEEFQQKKAELLAKL